MFLNSLETFLQSSILQEAGVDSFPSMAQSLGKRSRRLSTAIQFNCHWRAQQAQIFCMRSHLGERSRYGTSLAPSPRRTRTTSLMNLQYAGSGN